MCFGAGDWLMIYGIALFAMEQEIPDTRQRKVYHCLNTFGLTPWLCLRGIHSGFQQVVNDGEFAVACVKAAPSGVGNRRSR